MSKKKKKVCENASFKNLLVLLGYEGPDSAFPTKGCMSKTEKQQRHVLKAQRVCT